MQKSQKGRPSAAQQLEQIPRRKSGLNPQERGRQEFGGVAHRFDRDVDRLSNKAKRAIQQRVSRSKQG
ncbi:MAG: hypothetical protein A2X94_06605 [Bdellovibrionales bacterium GWB1_55_8]|nr:MAG: hypothetical protein A2X94_06605 [Bdellovibrionales bacterium GWB1_55_8]